jgi:hypothetical protein
MCLMRHVIYFQVDGDGPAAAAVDEPAPMDQDA